MIDFHPLSENEVIEEVEETIVSDIQNNLNFGDVL
jgi:hypothetical protein